MITRSIAEYTDYRDYLHDWFWAAKAANSKISFRYVAKHLGLSAPNHFHLVITKKRHFSTQALDKVARLLKLNARERQYFKLLHEWDHSVQVEQKTKISSKLKDVRHQLSHDKDSASEKGLPIVGNQLAWYIKMGSIVFEGMTKDKLAHAVTASCKFNISELDVFQALDILEASKMLSFETGVAQFEGDAIITKWDFDRSEIKRHHAGAIDLASKTIAWPIEQRFLNSVTVPCNKALYDTFVEEIRTLCRSIFDRANASVTDSKDISEVVTLQMAMFPYFQFK